MAKIVFGKPQASEQDSPKPVRLTRRRDPDSGKVTTMKVVNIDSKTFGSNFQQVFTGNVKRALKENKELEQSDR